MADWITAQVTPDTNNLLGGMTPAQIKTMTDALAAGNPPDWMSAPITPTPAPKVAASTPANTASPLTLGMDPSKFEAVASGLTSTTPQGPDTGAPSYQEQFAPAAQAHPGYATAGKVLGTGLLGSLGGAEGATLPSLLANMGKNAGLAEVSLGGSSAAQAIDPNNPLLAIAGGLAAPLSAGGAMTALKNIPDAFSGIKQAVMQRAGAALPQNKLDSLVGEYLNANAKTAPSITGLPTVPGFSPTPAAGANDLGLYPVQSALRSKGFGDLFEQRVGDNNAAITQGLRKLGPQLSPVQTSSQAANKLGTLNQASKAVVNDEYAPFDAIKNQVNVPSSPIVDSVENVLSGLNTSEKAMIPQPQLDQIYKWGGVVPLNEVEGVRGALGDAAQLAGNNGARVIKKVQGALDNGLNNVQTIHNADGTLMAPVNGQAPLQMMQQAREANVWYRQKFPTQGPNNTPAQNFMAKVVTGKIAPSKVLDTAMQTPENLGALLNASRGADGNPDPEILSLAQNHYVNQLFDASSNRAGGIANGQLINGFAMRDFRNGNADLEGMLFKDPTQRAALDDLQDAAVMNNKIIRSAVPGQSPTNQLGNTQSNMADFLQQGVVAGLEHFVPGAGLASKMLTKLAGAGSGAAQEQFRNRLAQAMLDIPTYTKLRNMPVTPKNVETAMTMLKAFPSKLRTALTATAANPGVQAAVAAGAAP